MEVFETQVIKSEPIDTVNEPANVENGFHPQPLPSPPPQKIGDANSVYANNYPVPLALKTEPDDNETENAQSENAHLSLELTGARTKFKNANFQKISADLKRRLVESGFSPYSQNDPVLKPYTCQVCGKAFGRLSHVRRHQLLHTGEKPFECEVCHEKFTRVENRTRHMGLHTGERRYNCDQCGKGFSQLNRLNVHVRIHSGERPFVCEICGKSFGRIDHKNSHMKTHNWVRDKIEPVQQTPPASSEVLINNTETKVENNESYWIEKPFRCPTCDKPFSRKDHLNRHIFIHSGTKPFKCDICSKLFSRKDNKYKHMASCIYMNFGIIIVKKPPTHEITSLEESKSLESKINEKLMEIQSGKFLMKPMSPKETLFQALQLSQKVQSSNDYPAFTDTATTGAENVKLPQSKDGAVEILLVRPNEQSRKTEPEVEIAKTSGEIEMSNTNETSGVTSESKEDACKKERIDDECKPVSIMDPDYIQEFTCDICEKIFLHKRHLVRHAMTHTGHKPYKCDQCAKSYYRKEHLQRHVIVHTGIKPYKCNFCDKSFLQVGQQMKHVLQHVNGESQFMKTEASNESAIEIDRSYSCDRCDKVYVRKSHLKRHYTIHTGEKPYTCEVCNQGFSRLEHQKRHMAIHTNIKKYDCEFCDKKFTRPDHVLAHIKRHVGVLPYKCNQCGSRFQSSKEKVEHLRTHTGAYRCEMCTERFELFVDLMEHRSLMHSEAEAIPKPEIMVDKQEQYPCPICQQLYDVITLGDHLKTHVQNSGCMEISINNTEDRSKDCSDDTNDEDDDDDEDDDMHSVNIYDYCAVKVEIDGSNDDQDPEVVSDGDLTKI